MGRLPSVQRAPPEVYAIENDYDRKFCAVNHEQEHLYRVRSDAPREHERQSLRQPRL